ncbi:MAG: PAS domain S-box protein [Chitinophagaceae bacterium]|nr:PAS domain S-box protein [Chitinophagaceae bacterium]
MSHLKLSKPVTLNNDNLLLGSRQEKENSESQIIQSLAAAVYTCDENGYIKLYNKAAATLWGREPEIGKDLWCGSWKIYEPDGVTRVSLDACPMAVALKEGRSIRGVEIIVERPDGERRNIMPHPDPIFNSSGKVVEAVNMLVDITDLKQKENELRNSEEKYRTLAEELQLALKTEEEFISIASHELKTPVTSISVFLEVLLEMHPELKDKHTNYMLTRSKAQVERLIGLIRDLLDVTKIKAGKLDLNFEEVDFNNMVDGVVHDHSSTISSHRIIKTGESNSKIRCDKNRIEQVLSNLLTNAVKYSGKANEIHFHISENKKNVQVDIQDFGIGIKDENKTKVFDRFFRANGKDAGMLSSLGLGLYISADIIKRHKGKIWVDSKMGNGSIFHFSLPKK